MFSSRILIGGSTIVQIPERLVFGVDKISGSAISPALKDLDLIDKNLLILLLLHERALGRASFWHEYICRIPHSFDTPVWWNESTIAALSGDPSRSDLYQYADYLRARLRRAWAEIVPPLARRHPALFPRAVYGYSQWLWAWSAVNSRNFRVAGRPGRGDPGEKTNVMLPVADMFNHRRDDNGTLTDEAGAAGAAGGFSVQTGPGRGAGEEIFLSYGEGVRARIERGAPVYTIESARTRTHSRTHALAHTRTYVHARTHESRANALVCARTHTCVHARTCIRAQCAHCA
jgi:hypothetical protein